MDNSPQVKASLKIRQPISVVFNAIIDPEITKHFWFTHSSGKLEKGKTVTWRWEMYNAEGKVVVEDIIENESITIYWGDPALKVEFLFKKLKEDHTYLTIIESGYTVEDQEIFTKIVDSTGGFTTVLDGMKAFLEHGINLNLIGDKHLME